MPNKNTNTENENTETQSSGRDTAGKVRSDKGLGDKNPEMDSRRPQSTGPTPKKGEDIDNDGGEEDMAEENEPQGVGRKGPQGEAPVSRPGGDGRAEVTTDGRDDGKPAPSIGPDGR